MFSNNKIEEEVINQAAQNLAKDIDREILWSFLEESGWTRVRLHKLNGYNTLLDVEIKSWAKLNCKAEFEAHGFDYLFQDKKDANWFKLRWM